MKISLVMMMVMTLSLSSFGYNNSAGISPTSLGVTVEGPQNTATTGFTEAGLVPFQMTQMTQTQQHGIASPFCFVLTFNELIDVDSMDWRRTVNQAGEFTFESTSGLYERCSDSGDAYSVNTHFSGLTYVFQTINGNVIIGNNACVLNTDPAYTLVYSHETVTEFGSDRVYTTPIKGVYAITVYYDVCYNTTNNKVRLGIVGTKSTISSQIADLTAQVALLTHVNDSLIAANTALKTQVTNLNTQVTTLTAQVATLNTQVTNLTADKAALTTQVTNLTTQVTDLTAENTELKANAVNMVEVLYDGVTTGTTVDVLSVANNTGTIELKALLDYYYNLGKTSGAPSTPVVNVNVYPNPVNTGATLNVEGQDLSSIEIYTIAGSLVKTVTDTQVSTSDLSNGLYLVKIYDTKGGVSTKKVTVQ